MITAPFGFLSGQNISSSLIEQLFMGGQFTTFQGLSSDQIASANLNGAPGTNFGSGFNGTVYAILQDPADIDKIYVGGDFTEYNGTTANGMIRLNLDGSIDPSFDVLAGFTLITSPAVVNVIKMFNGKLYVGGTFDEYRGVDAKRIIVLNRDGSKYTTFDNSNAFSSEVNDIVFDNNKIYVGGAFTSYKGVTANRLIRLNLDGSKDTGFVNTTGFNSIVFSIATDAAFSSPSSIYVGGRFTTWKGTTSNRLVKLDNTGTIDTSFDIGSGLAAGVTNTEARKLILDGSGKIYVGGNFTSYNGTSANRIVGIDINGDINAGFDYGTAFSGGIVSDLIPSNENEFTFSKIYAVGTFTDYKGASNNNRIILINSDGSKDATFVNNPGFDDHAWTIKRVSPPTYILDQYPGAGLAYSVRKLSSSYNGPALRVRRSSDNAETDIGFIYGYSLNTTALLNFCGAGNGFVTTWYDQSGNGVNATQTDTTKQPLIVSSGVIDTVSGVGNLDRPAIKFDGIDDFLQIAAPTAPSSASIFTVLKNIVKGGGNAAFNADLGGDVHHPWVDNTIYENFAASTRYASSSTGDICLDQHIYSVIGDTAYRMRLNKSIIFNAASGNTPSFDATSYFLGSSYVAPGATFYYNGYEQEVIIYFANKTSDVAEIEENLNTYFSVL
jgi:hypothetical protein